ncbi:SpoIID/LytB domain-containing protein [Candidatus Dependentiae bacterium]|nr:SpoIID/LytB domain-containing protein [Candidatus Dependentiae bacterium]
MPIITRSISSHTSNSITSVGKKYGIFALIMLCNMLALFPEQQPQDIMPEEVRAMPDHDIKKIRVLLEEHELPSDSRLVVQSKNSFILSCPSDTPTGVLFDTDKLNVLCSENRLYLECKDGKYRRLKHNSIEIASPHRKLTVGSKTYEGNIIIRLDREHKKVLVINKVPIENYVYAVVRCESLPSWPMDMQKIQAIISRSYAAYLMNKSRTNSSPYKYYDIRNTNLHQVYNGTHTIAHIRQAVDETEGQVLTYKGKIALTMFDICCGGSVPALMRCKDTSKPYLMRTKKCIYCAGCAHYSWKIDVSNQQFLTKLRANANIAEKLKKLNTITGIKVIDADKAGVVHKVKITGSNKNSVTISGRDIRRSLSPRAKSVNFTAKSIRNRIVIEGRGDGHQKGVCQFGCKELLTRGWNIAKILDFYYPGTTLSRLA